MNFEKTLITAIISLVTPVCAFGADDTPEMKVSNWAIRAGFYDTKADTSMRVDGNGGLVGTVLDVEDFLNVQEGKNTGFIAARYAFKQKHFFELEYFNIGRNGRRILDTSFAFDGTTFDVGADVATNITTEVYRLGYGYKFIHRENFVLAASVGIHVTSFEAAINATIDAGGGSFQDVAEFADVTAPLPVFGVSGGWQISDKLALVGRGQILRLEIDGIDGSLTHGSLALEHDTFEQVGFGVGYDFFDIDVSAANSEWNGDVKMSFEGPMVFVKLVF